MSEEYLGDGLYASFDGYQIILRAPRGGGDHFVALEDIVFKHFIEWIRDARDMPDRFKLIAARCSQTQIGIASGQDGEAD